MVRWGRVATFYGVALLGPLLTAGVLLAGGRQLAALPPLLTPILVGALSMGMPLVAGLVTERRAGRRPLLGQLWDAVRSAPGRILGGAALAALVAFVLVAGVTVLAALLGPVLGVEGLGRLATDAEVGDHLRALQPAVPEGFALPAAVLLASSAVQALVAGFTINAVFAFGEEYGWRGVLADELRPLGTVRANLVTGLLWGLWHAPLIVLGHNYGEQWGWGIPLFVLVCLPFSFVLSWSRERSRSLLAPAAVHGAFNGFVGVYLIVLTGADRLVGLPVGVAMAGTLAVVAAVLWLGPGLRPGKDRPYWASPYKRSPASPSPGTM